MNKKISTFFLAALGAILIGGFCVIDFFHKCSTAHPEFCDKSCEIDDDCYPSCTRDCGCINALEKCRGDIKCEVPPFSCECINNVCQIARFGDQDMSCNSNFNCQLVYIGSKPCAPCDSSIEDYKCLNSKKAQEVRSEKEQYRNSKKIECGVCPLPEYSCVCENQSCEKITIK